MLTFTTEQVVPFSFGVTDGRGRPVTVDGTPTVASSDETVARLDGDLVQDGNRWTGTLVSVAAGTARITVDADADLGAGVQDVTGVLEFEVTLDPRTGARMMDLQPGTPTDKSA